MKTFALPRSGDSKLRFTGELIAEADSKHQGPAENRYFELAVYRAESGKYVGAIGYRSHWQGEIDRDFAKVCADAGEVRQLFSGFDPCNPELWRGLPENAIRAAYQSAVSEILKADEFAETL
jgi:hypothetical protein